MKELDLRFKNRQSLRVNDFACDDDIGNFDLTAHIGFDQDTP